MNEKFLINYLENYNQVKLDNISNLQERIRALMNITMPLSLSDEFYQKQDEYLGQLLSKKKVISGEDILGENQIAIYLGDITNLKVDAIVNACNDSLLGCFVPLHHCIDNTIHSFGGLQVRRDLLKIMQGKREKNGKCRVTNAYNLPSKFVFHTVGPVYNGKITTQIKQDLENCYLSCLKQADKMGIGNIAFCSISTGVFGFPVDIASDIAIGAVKKYLTETKSKLKVIFNLFLKRDYEIYERKLKR